MTERPTPNETDRRIGDVARLGKVETVDLAAGRCTVSIGDVVSGPIPWLTGRAGETLVWSPPSVGEQVLLICPDGELGLGVALPGIFSTAMAAPDTEDRFTVKFSDEAVITYDPASHGLTLDLPEGATITINAPGGVTIDAGETGVAITGPLAVDGEITATGDISTDADVKAGAITLKTHRTSGVQHGAGTSDGPVV